MARTNAEQAALTRQKILGAAARIFCRDGIGGATLEGIAQEAGVTRGAIYWHFKGKQGLLEAMFREQALPFERGLPKHVGFAEGWELLCQALEETISDEAARCFSRIMLHKSERVADNSLVVLRLQQIRGGFIEQLQQLLGNAVAAGELDARLRVVLVSEIFESCITGLLFDSLQESGSKRVHACAMLETLRHLLLSPPDHWLDPVSV